MADETLNLNEQFQQGFRIFKQIEIDDRPINSSGLQDAICELIDCFKRVIEMINDLALFSSNEELDEISTTNLRYLLVPALLGELYLKLCSENRLEVVTMSKVYFSNYLERCKTYQLLEQDTNAMFECEHTLCINGKKSLEELATERQEKVKRYKRMKKQEEEIKEITNLLEHGSLSSTDEELQRKMNVLLLKNWIDKAVENISAINSELEILEHMAKVKCRTQNDNTELESDANSDKKNQLFSKPVLITREMIQNKVFGAGYPSLPTMTQEEYFEKELREGKIVTEYSEKQKFQDDNDSNRDEECVDETEDEKYFQKLARNREWDDWKDDHRRGWGNRENMG